MKLYSARRHFVSDATEQKKVSDRYIRSPLKNRQAPPNTCQQDVALGALSSFLAQRNPPKYINLHKDQHFLSHRRKSKTALFSYGIMILSMGEYIGIFLYSVCLSEHAPPDGGLPTLGLCPPIF